MEDERSENNDLVQADNAEDGSVFLSCMGVDNVE